MKIAVVGTGCVGLVPGARLADVGNRVVCLVSDATKIATLKASGIRIHELKSKSNSLVRANAAAGRLRLTLDVDLAVRHVRVQSIAAGAPLAEDGAMDANCVLAAARSIGTRMDSPHVATNESTVSVGTASRVREEVARTFAAPPSTPTIQSRLT